MNNPYRPTMTLPQVARLAEVTPQSIYLANAKTGKWRDLTPHKLVNGRYIFRTEEVHAVLGRVFDESAMSHGERAYAAFLDLEAIPATEVNFRIGQALLNQAIDYCRDPSYYADQMSLVFEVVLASCGRLDKSLPIMNDSDRERVRKTHRMIASLMASFDEAEVSHDK